jgi:sugar O-acyltransferase (sialic acid O-acetyltransferase NeuD family)
MKKIIIFGTGEIASMAKFYFRENNFDIAAFTVDDDFIKEDTKEGIPVIPFSEIIKNFNISDYSAHVALSYNDQNKLREKKYLELKKNCYNLESFISKKSNIDKNLKFGENCFILENQTIQHNVEIGNNVVIWSSNHIGHGSKIDDHTYISSHVVISGHSKIGKRCFFGVNSSVADFIDIDDDCFIGMSSSIGKNLKKGSFAINKSTEIYGENERVTNLLKKKYFSKTNR